MDSIEIAILVPLQPGARLSPDITSFSLVAASNRPRSRSEWTR